MLFCTGNWWFVRKQEVDGGWGFPITCPRARCEHLRAVFCVRVDGTAPLARERDRLLERDSSCSARALRRASREPALPWVKAFATPHFLLCRGSLRSPSDGEREEKREERGSKYFQTFEFPMDGTAPLAQCVLWQRACGQEQA